MVMVLVLLLLLLLLLLMMMMMMTMMMTTTTTTKRTNLIMMMLLLLQQVVNKIMYTGSSDHTARAWVTEFGDCTRIYKGHRHTVSVVKVYSGMGKDLLSSIQFNSNNFIYVCIYFNYMYLLTSFAL
jgi:uncharacterized membrane protein